MTRQAIIALRCLILASIGPGFSGSACHAAPTNPLHWNKGRGYAPFSHATPNGLRIVSNTDAPIADSCRLQTSPESFVLSFRAAARSSWGVFLSPDSGDKIWLTLAFEEIPDMLSSAPALTVKASRGSDGKILAEKKIREGVDLAGGKNVWRISSERGRISLLAGHRGLVPVFSFPVSGNSLSSFGFAVAPQGCLEIDNISLIPSVGRPAPFMPHLRKRLKIQSIMPTTLSWGIGPYSTAPSTKNSSGLAETIAWQSSMTAKTMS